MSSRSPSFIRFQSICRSLLQALVYEDPLALPQVAELGRQYQVDADSRPGKNRVEQANNDAARRVGMVGIFKVEQLMAAVSRAGLPQPSAIADPDSVPPSIDVLARHSPDRPKGESLVAGATPEGAGMQEDPERPVRDSWGPR
jgi:hypothetical protein